MHPNLFVFALLLLSFTEIAAQQLKGKVTAPDGSPVVFATVYIRESTLGIVSGEDGSFQATLPSGRYTVEARSMGFTPATQTVDVPLHGATVQIRLSEMVRQLDEVQVSPSKEDPAYEIIRRTIARAPIHRHQVLSYTADNYMRGTAKLESMPRLLKSMMKDPAFEKLIGKLFVLESQNRVTFTLPDRYEQQVVAYRSNIPEELKSAETRLLKVSTSTIYDHKYAGTPSPLSSQAFKYYKFRWVELFTQGTRQVNKIEVIPRLSKAPLFSGHLYIVEGSWSVYSLDLSTSDMGLSSRFKLDYQELQPDLFLPIAYTMQFDLSAMGVKGFAHYRSSVQYDDVKLNPQLSVIPNYESELFADTVAVPPVPPKQQRMQKELEVLAAKETLSKRDALKLATLSHRLTEPDELKARRESLEIIEPPQVLVKVDSMASVRDSVYWEQIRRVPLQAEERRSMEQRDTLRFKSLKSSDSTIEISSGSGKKSTSWLMGGTVKLNKKTTLRYDGLLRGVLREYNFVDGVWLGQKASLTLNLPRKRSLVVTPSVYYTTSRGMVNWNVKGELNYLPLRNGQWRLSLGDSSEDIQGEAGSSRLLNSLSSLIAGDNIVRLYRSKAVRLGNRIGLSNGLMLHTGISIEERSLLSNHTEFNIFGISPRPNLPEEERLKFPSHRSTEAWVALDYTPHNRYRIREGRRIDEGSGWPTFSLFYRTAFRIGSEAEQSLYHQVRLSVRQQIRLNQWSSFNYSVKLGSFIDRRQVYAPDRYYMATTPLFVSLDPFDHRFALLPNYTFSETNSLEGHANWQSDYLLLKRIPFLQRLPINEALHFNVLFAGPHHDFYTEAGYTVGVSQMFRAGVFTGSDSFSSFRFGFRLSVLLFGR